MSAPSRPGEGQPAREDDEPGVRKPYVKPAVQREGVFETTAVACGKVNPTQRQCQLVRKTS